MEQPRQFSGGNRNRNRIPRANQELVSRGIVDVPNASEIVEMLSSLSVNARSTVYILTAIGNLSQAITRNVQSRELTTWHGQRQVLHLSGFFQPTDVPDAAPNGALHVCLSNTNPEGGAVAERLIASGTVQVYVMIIGGPRIQEDLATPRLPPPIVIGRRRIQADR